MEDMDPEEQFLRYARNGDLPGIERLLLSKIREEAQININCKGKNKSNLGWTPLHLACYFGHKGVAEELLKSGADANIPNTMGDTPLHKAAFTGRKELVMLLLRFDACATVINGTAQIPKDVSDNAEIRSMLEAAERTEERKLEEQLLDASREGDLPSLNLLLNRKKPVDIHCVDLLGNTPLHCASYRGQRQCALRLLKTGASPNIKNKNGQSAFALANDAVMKQVLEGNVHPVGVMVSSKSSRFFGWRSYWVLLQDGVLSWYSKQYVTSVSNKVIQASLTSSAFQLDNCFFTVKCFDDSVHHFKVSPKTDPEGTRKAWLEALEEHAAYSTHYCSQEQSGEEEENEEELISALELKESLQVRSLKLEQECEKNQILSEALQTLATEHHELEQSVATGTPPGSTLSEEEFYDAVSESDSELSLSGSETLASPFFGGIFPQELFLFFPLQRVCLCPRTHLPAPMFSRNDFSIWSILRKCIGMELSKITMPVIFNEPLSFLQRLTEYMEHTYLLHRANAARDSIERMKCVAAFAVSAVASQWERTGKPFNPLLGETYELVREDLGFRLISEQVSHHPPVSAFHAEGLQKDFVFHGSIYPKLKFWGKSVEAEPKGIITLELPKYNEAYTWTNPTCCVHNIIVGQLWIEQYGNMEVINHKTGEKCCLIFKPCGLFGRELHKVEGYILDKSKRKVSALYGKWTECLYTVEPAAFDAHRRKGAAVKMDSKQASSKEPAANSLPATDTVEVISGSQLLWRIAPRPANSVEMYSFTTFAMQLNEMSGEMKELLPKTDCRLRPDIRAMESGNIDLASEEKNRLEEKQRAARKSHSKPDEDLKTRWFHQGPNPFINSQDWLFSGGYWDRNYTQLQLADIY
uniref:Oxysterol-binding protein n=1 Tax=Gadus morhua TaxID=8049 RepID=A0A8C5CVA6_GADMO